MRSLFIKRIVHVLSEWFGRFVQCGWDPNGLQWQHWQGSASTDKQFYFIYCELITIPPKSSITFTCLQFTSSNLNLSMNSKMIFFMFLQHWIINNLKEWISISSQLISELRFWEIPFWLRMEQGQFSSSLFKV